MQISAEGEKLSGLPRIYSDRVQRISRQTGKQNARGRMRRVEHVDPEDDERT